MLQSVAGAGHINNLAAVDEAVEDGGGNGRVAEEIGPLVKSLVGSNNEGSSFAHGGDEPKEKITAFCPSRFLVHWTASVSVAPLLDVHRRLASFGQPAPAWCGWLRPPAHRAIDFSAHRREASLGGKYRWSERT